MSWIRDARRGRMYPAINVTMLVENTRNAPPVYSVLPHSAAWLTQVARSLPLGTPTIASSVQIFRYNNSARFSKSPADEQTRKLPAQQLQVSRHTCASSRTSSFFALRPAYAMKRSRRLAKLSARGEAASYNDRCCFSCLHPV